MSAASRPRIRSAGLPSSTCAAWLASRSLWSESKAKIAMFDLLHHGAEQRGWLERAHPLILQRAAEDIDFQP
jgi:hypothetical protein